MSSFLLKILACFFMVIDHIGFLLLSKVAWLRMVGRLALPIFAFQVSIGFDKTKNKEKYILRMLLFTIVSQIPFYFFRKSALVNPGPSLNVGATFTVALLALYSLDKIKKPFLKYFCVGLLLAISIVVPMDYSWLGFLTVLIFYVFKDNVWGIGICYYLLVISYCLIKKSVFNLPALFALVPIFLYNHKKGKDIKYFFYVFYPLHFVVLLIIKALYFS